MDLRSDYPFWLLKNGNLQDYQSLKNDLTTEVAVIGSGITGALVGHYLAQAGIEVALLDRRHVATGSTAASTALLQYEIDTPLHQLTELVGEAHAVRSYRLCLEAIDKLRQVAADVGESAHFQTKKSLYYASYKKDVADLECEFAMRKRHGIGLDWLPEGEIREKFGFSAPAGLLSHQAAETDAFRLAHGLLRCIVEQGGQIYDKTEITDITYSARRVHLTTKNGSRIIAKRLVIAAGYESQRYLKQPVELLRSSFAVVSEALPQQKFWYENALIWETARPYLYMRTTADNRILVGGKDEPFYNPQKRDRLVAAKSRALTRAFCKKFPEIHFCTDYAWGGTFTETKDGLPYIGLSPERPLTYFALGFGGNGITFSLIAAEIICDLCLGKNNPDTEIFSFQRHR